MFFLLTHFSSRRETVQEIIQCHECNIIFTYFTSSFTANNDQSAFPHPQLWEQCICFCFDGVHYRKSSFYEALDSSPCAETGRVHQQHQRWQSLNTWPAAGHSVTAISTINWLWGWDSLMGSPCQRLGVKGPPVPPPSPTQATHWFHTCHVWTG